MIILEISLVYFRIANNLDVCNRMFIAAESILVLKAFSLSIFTFFLQTRISEIYNFIIHSHLPPTKLVSIKNCRLNHRKPLIISKPQYRFNISLFFRLLIYLFQHIGRVSAQLAPKACSPFNRHPLLVDAQMLGPKPRVCYHWLIFPFTFLLLVNSVYLRDVGCAPIYL